MAVPDRVPGRPGVLTLPLDVAPSPLFYGWRGSRLTGPLSCLGSYSWGVGLPFEPGLTDSPAMVQRRLSPQWAGDVFSARSL